VVALRVDCRLGTGPAAAARFGHDVGTRVDRATDERVPLAVLDHRRLELPTQRPFGQLALREPSPFPQRRQLSGEPQLRRDLRDSLVFSPFFVAAMLGTAWLFSTPARLRSDQIRTVVGRWWCLSGIRVVGIGRCVWWD
jgi:hypothetical protein